MILAIHHEDVYRRLRESARHRETAEPGSHHDDARLAGFPGVGRMGHTRWPALESELLA